MTTATMFRNSMMTFGASAQAEAPSFCARSAANTASLLMDAILVASIIICALICLASILVLGISLLLVLVLVLLAVLLLAGDFYTPRVRRRA